VAGCYIFSLRSEAWAEAWDKAAKRFLLCSSGREPYPLDKPILRYWRSLPADRLTADSLEILDAVDEGYSVREAALPYRAQSRKSRLAAVQAE
jgi:hypothetical protein